MGTEEVQIITLLGLMVALLFNARSYTLQANATDVSNFLEIHNLITEKWPYSGPRPTSPVALRRSISPVLCLYYQANPPPKIQLFDLLA